MMSPHRQQGMTLIELMISLLLGVFLIGGVLQVFINTKQTYRIQENMSRFQENGRFAMEFLIRDIRMADFWDCVDPANIENKLNSGSIFDAFNTSITGQNNDNSGAASEGVDADNNGLLDGTDSLSLAQAGSAIAVYEQPSTTAASIKVIDNSGLAQNDIVLISNCVAGDIFQITNVTGGSGFDNIIHNTGNVSSGPGNASSRLEAAPEPSPPEPQNNKYGTDAFIYKLNFSTYKISLNADNQPALFKSVNGGTFQELIEGVEDMQILYGEDTDANNTPDYYVPAGTVGLNMDQVVSIRISLLVRSIDDNLTSEPRPYTYNGVTQTPTDRRLRRVFSSTVAVRNRLQ